ncbi:GGDEF domain-containing protein [Pseudoalteromonas sp. YIC-656]|uniref:GGDEF domain-containing protein n=1 Tax=Pseudoalteromonas pernae TaxID=3118054 RepID=UPI0032425016
MDHYTILITMIISSAIMTLTLFSCYCIDLKQKHIADWALAGLFFMVASLTSFVSHFSDTNISLIILIVNSFFICGHALILHGCYLLKGKQQRYHYIAALFLLVAALHLIPAISGSTKTRLIFLSPIVISTNLLTIFIITSSGTKRFYKGLIPVACTVGVFLVFYSYRFFWLNLTSTSPMHHEDSFFYSGSLLVISSYYFILTIALIYTIFWIKENKLKALAITDELTGLLNRKTLDTLATKELKQAIREQSKLTFMMIDIDHFKSINDKHGHFLGDLVLKHVSELISQQIRDYDSLYRIGGEEFLLVATKTDHNAALGLAERIRRAIDQTTASNSNGINIGVTVSIGFSTNLPTDSNWEEIMKRADSALYEAKHKGRNRVEYTMLIGA